MSNGKSGERELSVLCSTDRVSPDGVGPYSSGDVTMEDDLVASGLEHLDECILEQLSLSGPLRLDSLQEKLDHREPRQDTSYGNLLYRIRHLRAHEFVTQEAGFFDLTESGRAYLQSDFHEASPSDESGSSAPEPSARTDD